MTHSRVNFLVKIPIRCWDINKTRQGITFIFCTLYMYVLLYYKTISSYQMRHSILLGVQTATFAVLACLAGVKAGCHFTFVGWQVW